MFSSSKDLEATCVVDRQQPTAAQTQQTDAYTSSTSILSHEIARKNIGSVVVFWESFTDKVMDFIVTETTQ